MLKPLFMLDVKKDKRKTICIDFDETLIKKQPYGDGIIYEQPIPESKESLDILKEKGYKIVILTTRLNPKFGGDLNWKKERIMLWLNNHKIPFDEVTNNKPPAEMYIDNKAVKFTNWKEAIEEI